MLSGLFFIIIERGVDEALNLCLRPSYESIEGQMFESRHQYYSELLSLAFHIRSEIIESSSPRSLTVDKLWIGELVVRLVTTGESSLLYVF
jgi:hypothetical protein